MIGAAMCRCGKTKLMAQSMCDECWNHTIGSKDSQCYHGRPILSCPECQGRGNVKCKGENIMEYKGELGHVLPNEMTGVTAHHVVTELTKELPKMDEIYVVTKDKDGMWLVSSKGSIGGIAHAVMLLHEYWNEQR